MSAFRLNGFTLFELVIVIALISLLSLIAYPSYQQYVTRARRADGQIALLDLANRMERHYLVHKTYATATIATANPQTDVSSQLTSPQAWYRLEISTQSKEQYSLQAHPQGAQAKTDRACQILTLNHLGVLDIKSTTAEKPSGNARACWGKIG